MPRRWTASRSAPRLQFAPMLYRGHLTPCSWQRAEAFRRWRSVMRWRRWSPRMRAADKRIVVATDSACRLRLQIQANMDLTTATVLRCTALLRKLTRGMKVKQVRSGKASVCTRCNFLCPGSGPGRQLAGDVVGIPNHGTLHIGTPDGR